MSSVDLFKVSFVVIDRRVVIAKGAPSPLIFDLEEIPYRIRYLESMHDIIYSFGNLWISEKRVDKQGNKDSFDFQPLT